MNNHDQQDNEEYYKIARGPWYQWVLWAVWLFLEIIFLQAAVASSKELEPRAAIVFWLLFGVFALGGITVWIIRRERLI
ncbi:MAG: hypothetical protein ISR58_04885 [Anaerolineales bacterium]|nr:hypothetical protein [Chloroflexota bacterium]MBL6980507.1 hypothetical protein [Anaerolineales bacterium]